MVEQMVFYFFAALAIFSASMVVISKHPVRSVLLLILTFLATSVLWLLLEAEFLALSLVLVYVGAVMVLFLFVVLMLDVEAEKQRGRFTQYLPLGMCVLVLFLILLVYAVGPQAFGTDKIAAPLKHAASYSNVTELGVLLFTKYLLQFELAGILLLAAIVAAIGLTFRGAQYRRSQNPSSQIKVTKKDRLRIIRSSEWPQP